MPHPHELPARSGPRAEDRAAIGELKARYFRCVDTKDWSGLRALFTDKARFLGMSRPFADGDAFVDWLSGYFAEATTDHHGGMPELTFTGVDTARGIWSMTDRVEFHSRRDPAGTQLTAGARVGPFGFTGAGHYHEEYRRIGGSWQISVLCLTRLRVDPLAGPSTFLVPPQGGLFACRASEWLAGSDAAGLW